jgi:UDP-GlcNAc:undecaprenyl-phosphate/decaprenyl-phosphate GlcNAc-1-phosphate transferase
VQSLPLVVSLASAAALAGPILRGLREQGLTQPNYRGAPVAFPAGIAIVVAAVVALVPLALLEELADDEVFGPGAGDVVTYVLGVALLGLLDDLAGTRARARGWRGHIAALREGRFTSGAAKAVGSLGLALFVLAGEGLSGGEYALAVAVVVLATNLFNLLDLRPGRSAKALVLLGAALTVGSLDLDPLWELGLFVGPVLVLLPLDLRERAMLGDTGSNAIGAVAGLWLVLTLSTAGQAIALGVIALATVYGEFRSISALIERTPLLRHLDSLGRTSHA